MNSHIDAAIFCKVDPRPISLPDRVEQLPCVPEVRLVNTLRKPAKDRREEFTGIGVPPLVTPEPREARRRPQLPKSCGLGSHYR